MYIKITVKVLEISQSSKRGGI